MKKEYIIPIIVAMLLYSIAIFFFGRSTKKCQVIQDKPDSIVVVHDTIEIPALTANVIHPIVPVVLPKDTSVEIGNITIHTIDETHIFNDTLKLNNEKLKGEIRHTTVYNGERAIGIWDAAIGVAEDIITTDSTVYKGKLEIKEIPVSEPFYSDTWFWSWLITAGGLILALIGAI